MPDFMQSNLHRNAVTLNKPTGTLEKFGMSQGSGSGATPVPAFAQLRIGQIEKARAAFNKALLGKAPSKGELQAAGKVFAAKKTGHQNAAKAGLNRAAAGNAPKAAQADALQQYSVWMSKAIERKSRSSAAKAGLAHGVVVPLTVAKGYVAPALAAEAGAAAGNGDTGGKTLAEHIEDSPGYASQLKSKWDGLPTWAKWTAVGVVGVIVVRKVIL